MTEKERKSEQLKGAHLMRKYILAKFRRTDWTKEDSVCDFERWLLHCADRFNKRKGGLGK